MGPHDLAGVVFDCPHTATAAAGVRAHRDLHHELQGGADNLREVRAGAEDLPEPQRQVRGEEHRAGQRLRQRPGGEMQACGGTPLVTGGVRRWTLPRGTPTHSHFSQ